MVRILHLSDPHLATPPDLVANTLDTSAVLTRAIDTLLARWDTLAAVDAVVVTGDITDKGDPASYQAFKSQIERLPVPYYLIPGNHDRREPMRTCFADSPYMPQAGKINWLHDLAGLRLIGLDTLVPGQGSGILDQETLDFLDDAIRDAGSRPLLIALHHPPFDTGIWFMDRIGLDGIDPLTEILSTAKGQVRIICGHVHSTSITTIAGHVAVSGPSISSSFLADYRADAPMGFVTHPTGYMIHDWNGVFRSTFVPLISDAKLHPF